MFRKNKIILALAIFFFVGALVFAGGPKRRIPLPGTAAPQPYADSEVLVKFKEGVDLAAINKFLSAQSLVMKKQFGLLSRMKGQQIVHLKSTKKIDALVLAKALSSDPSVVYAHPNYRRELAATPNDTNYSSLWGMHNTGQTGGTSDADIDAPEAWDISTGSSNIVVAVIDSGIDYNHPDLIPNLWKNPGEIAGNGVDDDGNGYIDDIYGIDPAGADGSSTNPGDTDPMDGIGHGTHCSGTIGARGNNSLGVVGVNWDVKIMALKFFGDYDGGGWDADAIECMQYAVYQKTHGQNVVAINASWGGVPGRTQDSGPLRDAIEIVNNAGIVFCAAAGNGGSDGVSDNNDQQNGRNHHYPSDYTLPGIIAVAATNHNDALGTFSNYGATSIDLGAPGVAILSTIPSIYVPGAGGDIFFDNVNNGAVNWTHGAISGTDFWQITTDQEGFANANFPVPSPPDFWSDRPGANYADNSNTWLAYNTNIDLSGYIGQNVYLGIGSAVAVDVSDHAYVEFSNNGGSTWTVIHDFTDEGWYWSNWSWLIPDSYKTSQFRMRFRLASNSSGNWIGWLIDDVGIGLVNTYYDSWDGTSMATPHVAGAVAYLASIFPNETVAQRKQRILYGGDSKTSLSGITVTGRRLNLYGAYNFTPASGPSITVTSPNGGEVWMIGTSYPITWTTIGTVGTVDIYYSLNSGASWTSIVTNTANDGTHSWTIPSVTPSTNCLIRIWENSDREPSDTSDAVFSIIATTTETVSTPTMPTGPTSGMVGTTYTYSTGGSTSSSGHSIEYRFDWGDGTYSLWLPVGTTSASHSWTASGTYSVRAMARCSTHYVQSAWSAALAVDLGDTPTFAAVSHFGVSPSEPLPTVEWHTAAEMGSAGFALFRQDGRTREFLPVSAQFLPALAGSPRGGVYRLADPGAYPGEPQVYRLDELDSQGIVKSYGPFMLNFGARDREAIDPGVRIGREEAGDVHGYQRYPREQSLYELERLEERRQELQRGELQAVGGGERARVTVKGQGLFYVQAAQAARALGMSEDAARTLIARQDLKLTRRGQDIAWLADDNGAGLFFYNEGQETIYSDRNVYYLEPGTGRAMGRVGAGSSGSAGGQSFLDSRHFEQDRYPLLISSMDPAGDLWFWDYVSGGGSKAFAVEVPGVAPGRAKLKVSLQGATETAASQDHHAVVSVNGRQVGEALWDGTRAHAFEAEFDASLLQDGGNAITLAGQLDTGAPYSVFYLESLDLSYPRYYQAVNNQLICRGDGNRVITVSGLTERQVVVLDVTTPEQPQLVAGWMEELSGRLSFAPRSAETPYLVSGLNAALRPESVVGDQPSRLKDGSRSAEHVIIAPREFRETAAELAAHRKKGGLNSLVVTLEEIYDAFNFGEANPRVIRKFLLYARQNWSGGKVKYAVLAGKGTYDYKDCRGYGDNMVPALLGKTPEGLCAADRIYGDLEGQDGVAEIAIGRLPAVTQAELKGMIDKIKAYESGQGVWLDKALLIADNADSGGDFAAGCDELAGLAVGTQAEKIYLAGSPAETRAGIIAAWNAGAGLVNYCGHAGIDQLATENLLDVSAVLGLGNGEKLPLVTMYTCAAGRFELPGFMSLGEALLANANGGMAGGMLPSGAPYHSDSMKLGEQFYKAVYQAKAARAGEAWLAALKNYVLLGGKLSLLNVYNWLGDPGMLLK